MSDLPHRRAMADVDKVAEAICGADLVPGMWDRLGPASKTRFRSLALAAMDALTLTEDRRRISHHPARAKPCDECGHLKGVHAEPCHIWSHVENRECGCPEHVYIFPSR